MVLGAMDLVLESGVGSTAMSTLRLPGVRSGVLILEALYVPVLPAAPGLRLGRFLTESLVRVVVDSAGNDLGQVLGRAQLDRLAENVPARRAQEFLRHVRDEVEALLVRAEALARPRRGGLRAAALARAEETLGAERRRLAELARRNPSVSAAELDALESRTAAARAGVAELDLRLDALRIAVTT
jgi:ATP-dependent helicase HepA